MKPLVSVVLAGMVAVACASSGGVRQSGDPSAPKRGSRNSATCPAEIDSMFLGRGPVYRQCDVDVAARAEPVSVHPDYMPSPRERCVSAEFEFVVGTDGMPEVDAIRLVSSSNASFAESIRRVIPSLRYRPAQKGGVAVRQLTRFSMMARASVSGARSAPPPPSARC